MVNCACAFDAASHMGIDLQVNDARIRIRQPDPTLDRCSDRFDILLDIAEGVGQQFGTFAVDCSANVTPYSPLMA